MKKWIDIGAQALMGLIFFVFGLNGFLHFLPDPEVTGDAATYMGGLGAAGYFFPVLKVVEVVAGFLLLIRKFPALALVPLLLIEAYLGFGVYRERFKDVLRA